MKLIVNKMKLTVRWPKHSPLFWNLDSSGYVRNHRLLSLEYLDRTDGDGVGLSLTLIWIQIAVTWRTPKEIK